MDTKMDKNEVAKDLMKSKVNAKFSHYSAGNLYYTVEVLGGIYQFPIETTEIDNDATNRLGRSLLFLSSDLGTTSFHAEMRGSELNRWIRKAIEKEEFIKVG